MPAEPGLLLYPRNLTGADHYFGIVARHASCQAQPFDLARLALAEEQSAVWDSLLTGPVALLVLPASYKITEERIALWRGRVRALGTPSTGTDHVDLSALSREGVDFFHSPGANAWSVVEYTLSCLPRLFTSADLLSGSVSVGIVGYGRIGSRLGQALRSLGMKYAYADPFVPGKERLPLEDVLRMDAVSFHVPLTRKVPHATEAMIGPEARAQFRPGSRLINTSRGEIFHVTSYLALVERHAAAMDVYPHEPPQPEFLKAPTLTTPHVAGYNYAARLLGTRRVAEQFLAQLGIDCELSDPPAPLLEHNVVDFLEGESAALKESPESFGPRRSAYPHRGSYRDWDGGNVAKMSQDYHHRVQQVLALLEEK